MIADIHVHTKYSCDSTALMENYCENAISQGVDCICFTEHVDYNKNDDGYGFYQPEEYFTQLGMLKKMYQSRIKILSGIEFSEPHLYREQLTQLSKYNYDYIIGSIHWVGDLFPCKEVRERYSAKEFYQLYWEEVLKAVTCGGFDSVGHIDFPKRYYGETVYLEDCMRNIFRIMIENNIALELNSSSLRKGFTESMPDHPLLSLYRECGGKMVTLGSDAHEARDLAADFGYLQKLVKVHGLDIVYFEKRKAVLIN